jgi:hypothetical protein
MRLSRWPRSCKCGTNLKTDVRAQPIGGFSSVKLFTMREFLFQQAALRLLAENTREIVVLDLSPRLRALPAKASRDALAEQAKLAADQYPEAVEMWPCIARR